MSIAIIALAVLTSLGVLSAAAADSTAAIINRDRAIAEAQEAVDAVTESCSTRSGCELPPNCTPESAPNGPGPNETSGRQCHVCINDSVIQARVAIAFETVLLKGLTPARGTYLSDLAIIDAASLRGLTICSG